MDPNVAGSSPVDRPSLSSGTMSTLEALILGIIQGLTEFLPVSSSGHLELGQFFLGLTDLHHYILFDLVCHLGTLLAVIIVFFQQIKQVLVEDRTRLFQIVLGTLPLFPLVLLIKPIKALFDQPEYLGYCFLLTALLLYLGIRLGPLIEARRKPSRWNDALVIGIFQAVAILPGVSRSGATISAGRLLGWSSQDAIQFSFLLAIPAILGGVTLELLQLATSSQSPSSSSNIVGLPQYLLGFISSLVVGYIALCWMMKLAAKNKFQYFVWYCIFIGITTLVYFNFT